MSRYEAFSAHRLVVRNVETGMVVEKECDAAWWVSAPSWAQLYIMNGMRQELGEAEEAAASTESDGVVID